MPAYDFKMLSWTDFEELCCHLLASDLSCHVESFKKGKDGGVDLRYTKAGKDTIVQCKHYADAGFNSLYQNLKEERQKLDILKPKTYRILTSVSLNPFQKSKIFKLFHPYMQSTGQIWGAKDINSALQRNPKVEEAHFKLWLTSTNVLKKVLHRKTYTATDFNISKIKEEIKLYVDNDSFPKAYKILEDKHALIISGPPGVGKTTLADMLMYHYIGNNFEPIYITGKVDEIYDVVDTTRKQIIVFDDFLGAIRLEPSRLGTIDRRVQDLLELVGKSHKTRFILTTREHILKQAQDFSERLAHKNIDYLKFVLDVGLYTRYVKAKILYNHVRYSKLPEAYVDELLRDGFYKQIIDHPGFNPRIISWLGEDVFYEQIPLESFQEKILTILDNPTELWRVIYRSHFSDWAQSLLITAATMTEAEVKWMQYCFTPIHTAICEKFNLPRKANDFSRAAAETENTFLKISPHNYKSGTWISFINPSLREFLETEWWENEEIRAIVLQNLSTVSQLQSVIHFIKYDLTKGKVRSYEIPDKYLKLLKNSALKIIKNISDMDGKTDGSIIRFADYILSDFSKILSEKEISESLEILIPYIEKIAINDNTEAENLSDLIDFFYYDDNSEKYSNILEQIKSIMWKVSSNWNLVEIHTNFSKKIKEYESLFSDKEISNYENVCLSYIEDADDDYRERNLDDLPEYQENLKDLLEAWDIPSTSYMNRLEQHIEQTEADMFSGDHNDHGVSRPIQKDSSTPANDSELEALFSSLKAK